MRFCGRGVEAFRTALDAAIREPEGLHKWYLSVIHDMAAYEQVDTVSIRGQWWGEIDTPADLAEVRAHFTQAGVIASYAS
jgi:choline kinase